jgi:phospholipase C
VLLGFRVPTVVVSPFTRNAAGTPEVNHTVFDHTSVLKLIEWRWGVPPLTARDASPLIGNFATALNFSAPNASVPTVPLPRPVIAAPCFENIVGLLTPSKPLARHIGAQEPNPWAVLSAWSGMNEWRKQLKFPAVR